jgi:hypothetical protein
MRTKLAAIVIALGLLVAARVEAGTFTFQQADVTVEVPDGWATEDEGGYVTFTAPDQTVAINLAWGGADAKAAWKTLEKEAKALVKGLKLKKAAGWVGGLEGWVAAGKGKLEGTAVDARLGIVHAPGGAMSVFVIGQTGKYDAHWQALYTMLDSLQPASGERLVVVGADFGGVAEPGQHFAKYLARAIATNDAKAFVKLVGKKGLAFADGENGASSRTLKGSKLTAAIKKAGGVAALLGVPASGAFNVELGQLGESLGLAFTMSRGDGQGVVAHLYAEGGTGGWKLVSVYYQDHGVDEGDGM